MNIVKIYKIRVVPKIINNNSKINKIIIIKILTKIKIKIKTKIQMVTRTSSNNSSSNSNNKILKTNKVVTHKITQINKYLLNNKGVKIIKIKL